MFRLIKPSTIFLVLSLISGSYTNAQIAINTTGSAPDSTAILDVSSSDRGMLVPRMSTTQRAAIASPATGLLVYDTDEGSFWYYENDQWNGIATPKVDSTLAGQTDLNVVDNVLTVGDDPIALIQKDNFLLFVDNTDQLRSVDIRDPKNMTIANSLGFSQNNTLRDIEIKGNVAYVADSGNSNDLHVVDISDPTSMTLISSYNIGNNILSVKISGDYGYCYDWGTEKLLVITVADSTSVSVVSTLSGFPRNAGSSDQEGSIVIDGNTLYLLHAFQGNNDLACTAVDISDPTNLTIASTVNVGDLDYNGEPYQMLMVNDQYLYVAPRLGSAGADNVVIDISNPSALSVAGSFFTTSGMAVSGTTVFAEADNDDATKLTTLDISNPLAPVVSETLDLPLSNNVALTYLLIDGAYLYYTVAGNQIGAVKVFLQYVTTQTGNTISLEPLYDYSGDISDLRNDLQNAAPVGTIQMWPTSTPPKGWLICNGSSFSSSTYPDLAAVLGTTNLPNFNGRFPLGTGNSGTNGSTQHNLSSNGGEEKHTLTINEMPSHNHGSGTLKTSQEYLSETGSGTQDKRDGGGTKLYAYDDITGNTASVGGNQSHNNMPPFYTINFIITAQ